MADNKNVYDIGLAMAGAISAGAYSAGVVDFLFQALDEWEVAKRDDPDGVPNHSVCIRAAAGASAGSITAALAAVAVAGGLRPQKVDEPKKDEQPYRCVLPALYQAWVTLPDMAARQPGALDLLTNDDLEDGVSPQSILNAAVLDDLTDKTLAVAAPAEGVAPGPAHGGEPLPYLAERLHLFLTLSNMRGVPYFVGFEGSGRDRGHHMMCHGDRAHYVLNGIGAHRGENAWLIDDDYDVLEVRTAPGGDKADVASNKDWQMYGRTALASAAFPLGLAARPIKSDISRYATRKWPHLSATDKHEPPDWPKSWKDKKAYPYNFMSVDGGLIDNEPFEYARRAIMRDKEDNKTGESSVKGAVVMVDPFPEPPAFSLREMERASIFEVARGVFPMLKNQARFKPATLATAFDNANYSRWMIAPSRPVKGTQGKENERHTIATGVLGGFGGFLDEAFRAHDYQLGRRNCQKFLRDIFSVGEGHPFVKDWPAGVPERFRKHDDDTQRFYYPVIPLVGTAALPVPAPEWPQMSQERLAEVEKRIGQRAAYIVPRLITSKTRHKLMNAAAWLLWVWKGKRRLLKYVDRVVEADLIRRNQLETATPYSAEAREVLAELKAPGYDYRTAKGIDQAIDLNEQQIEAALKELEKIPNLLWSGQVKDRQCWVLSVRRPSWRKRHDPFRGEPVIG